MPQGYKFTLLANQYMARGMSFTKPFEIVIEEGSDQLGFFKGNRAFKEEAMYIPEGAEISVAGKPKPPRGELGGLDIFEIKGISKKHAKILSTAGFQSAESIVDESIAFETLSDLKGLGESSVEKIIEACETALAEKEKSKEDED